MSHYDIIEDILTHVDLVKADMKTIINDLLRIGEHQETNMLVYHLTNAMKNHDKSKLSDFEFQGYCKFTPILKEVEFGSEAYKAVLEEMKPLTDFHYRNNSHHPEHYANGMKDMTLVDIIEMVCDWNAAAKRKNADVTKGIEFNQTRYGFDDYTKEIFVNTCNMLNGKVNPVKCNILYVCERYTGDGVKEIPFSRLY